MRPAGGNCGSTESAANPPGDTQRLSLGIGQGKPERSGRDSYRDEMINSVTGNDLRSQVRHKAARGTSRAAHAGTRCSPGSRRDRSEIVSLMVAGMVTEALPRAPLRPVAPACETRVRPGCHGQSESDHAGCHGPPGPGPAGPPGGLRRDGLTPRRAAWNSRDRTVSPEK